MHHRLLKPEIVFAHIPRSEALDAAIRRRVEHLTQYCDDLHACRVVVDQPRRHSTQGRTFEVRVDVTLNGRELVANRSRHEDVYVAMRDAFDGMVRQIEGAVRRRLAGPRYRQSVRHGGVGGQETVAGPGQASSATPPASAEAAAPAQPAAGTAARSSG